MAKTVKRPGRVKGAVLLMVLSIMVVIMILIIGTMGVVASSYRRSVVKYEENQAYYSARSGLDLMDELVSDTTKTYKSGKASTANETIKRDGNPSFGMVIEKALVGQFDDAAKTYDVSKSLEVYDSTKTYTEAQLKKTYIEFEMDLSKLDAQAGSEGGVGKSATVRIQLLDLIYDDGGSGIDRMTVTNKTAALTNGNALGGYIDTLRYVISCTVESDPALGGSDVTVSREYLNKIEQVVASPGTVSTGSSTFDNGTIFGGCVSAGDATWGNDSTIVRNVLINGDLESTRGKTVYLATDDSVVVNGKYECSAPQSDLKIRVIKPATAGADHPYMFVRDKITTPNSFDIGGNAADNSKTAAWAKVDLICRGMEIKQNNLPKIYGNLYCDGALVISGTSINFTSTPLVKGDLYVSDNKEVDYTNNVKQLHKLDWAGNPEKDWTGAYIMYDAFVETGTTTPMEKTTFGVIKPIVERNPSTGNVDSVDWKMVDPSDGKTYFKVNTDGGSLGGKLFNKIKDGKLNEALCSGDIYYYFKSTSTSFEGAWELAAIHDMLTVAAGNGNQVNTIDDYGNKGTQNINNAGGMASKFHKVATDDMKYLCQIQDSEKFLNEEGDPTKVIKVNKYSTGNYGYTLNDPNKNTSYKFYMSLPNKASGRTTVTGAGDAKSKLVPTLMNAYSTYMFINSERILTSSEIDAGLASTTLWNPTLDKYALLALSSTNAVIPGTTTFYKVYNKHAGIEFWDPHENSGAGGAKTEEFPKALSRVANGTSDPYDPDEKLNCIMSILNGIYQCNPTTGKSDDFEHPIIQFMLPAMAVAKNDSSVVYDNFTSVSNYNEAKTQAKGTDIQIINPMNGGVAEIDCTSKNVLVLLKEGTYMNAPKIEVKGTYKAFMLMEKTATGTGKYSFTNSRIWDENYAAITSGNKLYHGSSPWSSTDSTVKKLTVPNIMLYADNEVKLNFSNNNAICAYVYGPGMDVHFDMGAGKTYQTSYDGAPVITAGTTDIDGSLFARNISGSNNMSSTYISTEQPPGDNEKLVKIRQSIYTNNHVVYVP